MHTVFLVCNSEIKHSDTMKRRNPLGDPALLRFKTCSVVCLFDQALEENLHGLATLGRVTSGRGVDDGLFFAPSGERGYLSALVTY